jgi:hypothetical protein
MITSHIITANGVSTQVYDHIRCNSNPNGGAPYRCEYEFPVKRLNILPDQVELVLFDDAGGPGGKEIGNRAYGVYLAVLGLIGGGASVIENPFCQDPRMPAAGQLSMRRPYQVFTEGQIFVDRPSSALTCRGCSIGIAFGDLLNFFSTSFQAFF